MRSPFTALYVHLIWATWDRLPLVTPGIRNQVMAAMGAKCRGLGAEPVAIGLVADHAHLLARIPPSLAVSVPAREVKGSSSHLVNHVLAPAGTFRWQGAYRAFTVSGDQVPAVKAYVENQEQHHRGGDLKAEWESRESESADEPQGKSAGNG